MQMKACEGLMLEEMSTREELGSLPVENVQALASSNSNSGDIPVRYLRPGVRSEEVLTDETLQIPTIDMTKLMVDDDAEMEKLHLACKHWGFFQVFNHGVAEEVTEKMKMNVQEFFQLPLEKNKVYAQPPNDIEGYGQAFVGFSRPEA